jgi:hypothetical protein
MTIPTGWKDDGTTLVAPNGTPVILGFRDYVLNHAWNPDDWPLAPERHLESLEPGDPTAGAGQRQDFRMSSLGWNQAHGVYRIWVGRDLVALAAQVAELQTKLAAIPAGGPASDADAAAKALAAIHALAAALGKAA